MDEKKISPKKVAADFLAGLESGLTPDSLIDEVYWYSYSLSASVIQTLCEGDAL